MVEEELQLEKDKKINPLKRFLRYVFSTRWFVLLTAIIILLKTIFFYSDTVFHNDRIWLWSVRQTCMFIVIIVFPMLLFRKSIRRFQFGIIINILISLLLFADELYYTYASNILSVMQTGNMQYKDEILAAIPTLLNPRQILYFIDFIIFIILFVTKFVKIKKEKNFKFIPIIASLACIVFFCTSYHLIPESLELVTGYIYSKYKSVRYGTIYGYHYIDVKNAITNNKGADYETYNEMMEAYEDLRNVQNEYSANVTPNSEDYTGIATGKNMFVIQLESIQEFPVGMEINGKEITPNLNKFFAENINITNMHASSYTTTADSEHSFISSIYPSENGEAFTKYYSNSYDDVFKGFKNAGYTNVYAHGNYDTFWNRKNVFSKYDLDKVYFIDSFEDRSELIRTYLSDELFYKQIFDMIPDLGTKPVFADLIAASSHKPFELSGIIDKYSKVSIDVGEYSGTQLGNYLEAVNYADYAFGIFLDELKARGLYDNSVILVYGDHYGMPMYDEDLIKFLGEDPENYNSIRMQYEFSNVACGMRIPGVENLTIDYPTSKIDLKSTLFQIFGIEEEFTLGTSIFRAKPYVCINNGKIITDKYYYDTEGWYVLETGESVDMDALDEETKTYLDNVVEYTKKELGISTSILTENLLKDHLK